MGKTLNQTLIPTLADIVKEKIVELRKYVEDQVVATQGSEGLQVVAMTENALDLKKNVSIVKQAEALIQFDNVIIKRLGVNFQIPTDDSLPPNLMDINFNSFLAETLLREGSLLLDRCLQQRSEHDELKTKFFEACIQLDELERLNDITTLEEKDYDKSIGIAQSEKNVLDKENEQLAVLKQKFDKVSTYAGEVNTSTSPQAKAMSNIAAQQTYLYYADLSRWSMESIQAATGIQQQEGLIKTNVERLKGIQINIDLKKSQAALQIARNDVARTIALRRAEQIRNEGGALNLGEQMKPIKARFDNDLMSAYLRLSKVDEGFKQLYQYPINSFPKLSDKRELDFDDLVTWCQYTNTWLASFLDNQQQVTRSFSLGQLLSGQGRNFNDGLTTGKWQFKLNEEHFYNSKFVRLRGFAIQIDSGHFSGNWNIAVTPPTKAKIRREKDIPDIDQKVGTLYLGRVNETTFQVVPESAAPPKLYNASPIGQDVQGGEWTIEIKGMSTNGEKAASAILDIDIHLTVALV